ncbi:MAG: XdhC family protein [Alphaproteobacteria bacterium]
MNRATLESLLALRAAKQPAVLVTDLATGAQALVRAEDDSAPPPFPAELVPAVREALGDDASRVAELGGRRLFLHAFNPPLRMIVVGAVHIAQALAPMAGLAGYEVAVVDPRRSFASDARFPNTTVIAEWPDEAMARLAPDRRTAVVTLTHDPKLDDPALESALKSESFYIAALGSKRTHEKRLARLRERGFDDAALGRIHGPAGLDLGAVSPAEIAISIVAQATGVLRGDGPA